MGSRWRPLLSRTRILFCNILSTQDHAAWKGDKLPKLWWSTEQKRTALGADFLNDGILRTTDVMIGDKRVCGYGDVGKPCTFTLRGSGAKVLILEREPIGAMKVDMEDFMVAATESAVLEIAICVLSNGISDISTDEHMKEVKNNAPSAFGAGTRGLISDIEWWVEGFVEVLVSNTGYIDNDIGIEGMKVDDIQSGSMGDSSI